MRKLPTGVALNLSPDPQWQLLLVDRSFFFVSSRTLHDPFAESKTASSRCNMDTNARDTRSPVTFLIRPIPYPHEHLAPIQPMRQMKEYMKQIVHNPC